MPTRPGSAPISTSPYRVPPSAPASLSCFVIRRMVGSKQPMSTRCRRPVARIEVQRLHATTIALAGSSGQALAFGPGHVELTPDAGERGVAVYSAHRDTHFRFLKDVIVGDVIDIIRSDGRRFRHRVDG